jgi:hypothetical protein
MFERFTDRARRVLVLAQEEARLLNHSFIGTEHILLGLIHEGEGVAAKALESLGISLEAVREKVEETIGPAGSAPTGSPPFTPRAKKVLELSLREALQLGHNYIGTEHMLLGLVREGEGVAAQVLVSLGADLLRVRQQVLQLLSGYQGPEGIPDEPVTAIAAFQRRRPGSPAVAVGKEWSAQVVRAGRRPDDYANGYAELAELVIGFGFDLDDMDAAEIALSSVETTEGPGFVVSVKHRVDDEEMGEGSPAD